MIIHFILMYALQNPTYTSVIIPMHGNGLEGFPWHTYQANPLQDILLSIIMGYILV
jgi:hypothetical protein